MKNNCILSSIYNDYTSNCFLYSNGYKQKYKTTNYI